MKIESKDLRIGNYVHSGFMNPSPKGLQKCFNLCEVKALGIEKIIVTEKIGKKGLEKHNYSNIKPIPLTEEWLLKFGFKEVEGFFVKGHLRLLAIRDLYWRANYPIIVDIIHVHQLQNLYFALTGKELTLKK